MKKNLILVGFLVASIGFAFALPSEKRKKLSPEERLALRERIKVKMTGGLVRESGSAKGAFVILNSQNEIANIKFNSLTLYLKETLAIPVVIKEIPELSVEIIQDEIKKAGGSVGIGIVDNPSLPSILIAPETGWAIINITKLSEKCSNKDMLSARLRKEILRGLAFITGCAYTTMADPLMRDVTKPSDIDALKAEKFGLEVHNKFISSAPLYGLKPWRVVTYRKAVEEGWAPAPTNDIQKAIWDRVHAAPKNPMKIEFDPKKGR